MAQMYSTMPMTGAGRRLAVVVFFGATACTSMPPTLVLPSLPLSDRAFQPTLEASTESAITAGNTVEILLNGDHTFPVMLEAIKSAQRTITFETFIFRKGDVAERFVEAFADRCRAGVEVKLLLDGHGSRGVPSAYVDRLQAAGCSVATFRPMRPWAIVKSNHRNHRRVFVIDGKIAFTGGYAIDDRWAGDGRTKGRWRETNLRVTGPAVQHLQAAFVEHWLEATGTLLGGSGYFPEGDGVNVRGGTRAQVVTSSPYRKDFGLYLLFLQAVAGAQRSIMISTPYLFPTSQLATILKDAAHRGVAISILIPSVTTDAGVEYVVQETHRELFDGLLEVGVKLYEYRPALLHTKMMVIDGTWATVGSTNFDNRAMAINDELNVVTYDPAVAKRLEEIFAEDLTYARPLTREALKNRSWLGRFIGKSTYPLKDQF